MKRGPTAFSAALSRREFIYSSAAALAATKLHGETSAGGNKDDELLRWVDPRIGTGGHGHCFPGATVPFGAVQLSPDTYNAGWDWCSGYHVSDSSIMGFSHTHLSGTGCGDLLDFLVMPCVGSTKIVPGSREHPEQGYRSRFSHDDEVMTPGYYSVLLKDYGIKVELTATERAGMHRYTFPASEKAYLVLDLNHSYVWHESDKNVISATLAQTGAMQLAGGRVTKAWGNGRHCYFALHVSKKPERIVFYSDDQVVPFSTATLSGTNLKCVMHFKTHAGEQILVKTGISGVSAAGAARNVRAEIPGWNFDSVHRAARAKWASQIGKVQATLATDAHRRTFYTALYHMSMGPTLFDDVDGQYRGMDQAIQRLPAGQRNYTTFSCWDTYRAAHPAYTLIERERVPDFANTLIRMATQSPAGMPVWPLQGCETGTMTGYHSAAIIAEAIHKGFPGIDAPTAYKAMMKRAMVDNYRGLDWYRKLHYIPADKEEESVSKTFEYCYDDWAIAHVAKKLGHDADAAMLTTRSTNYRNYFDPTIGFVRPKLADGSWATPFTPISMGHMKKWRDFTESNSWQTTFAVQHDAAGMIAQFGGRTQFVAKLDELFTTSSELPPDAPPDIAGLVGQYAQGNEPSHHVAYLYVFAGQPWKTQARVRGLMETMYSDHADGMQGNEDVGQMSAWYLLSALGFYPVDAVSGNFILGSPLVDHAVLQLGGGRRLTIEVARSDPSHPYIQSFALNGVPQQRAWFHYSEIIEGGTLSLKMGAEPNLSFAVDAVPPSLTL